MKNTAIEWADHTINFWIGCPKISDGCKEARPFDLEGVRHNIAEAKAANIPVFTKQLGSHWARANGAKDPKGADPAEWPEPFPRETPWD